MSKRALIAAAVVSFVAAACSGGSEPEFSLGAGRRFVPQVVDAVTDVGRSPSIVLNGAGEPAISYLGFNSIPQEGEIPEARTIEMPLVPGVLMANAQAGYWNVTGVVEQSDALVDEPDAEQQTPYADASTATAVDDQGALHVAWIDREGVRYAADAGGRFEPETVVEGKDIYGLSMAVDDGNRVWISYFHNGAVISALKLDGDWTEQVVAKPGSCGAECPITDTATATLGHEPVIAFTDSNGATVAVYSGIEWDLESLPGDGGFAVSAASTRDGPLVSYVASSGEVTVAEYAGSTWKTELGTTVEMLPSPWLTTGVAQDEDGTRYLTWYDPASDSVKLAVDSGSGFAPVSTPETGGGAMPSIVAAKGGAWLAWYDHTNENLQAGYYGEQEPVLAVASPEVVAPLVPPEPVPNEPAPAPEQPTEPAPEPGTGSDAEPVTLSIESPQGSVVTGFDKTSLSAPADTPIQIRFNNSDPGVPHNVEILTGDPMADPSAESLFNGETITGPAEIVYDVQPLTAADYFYRCIIHPTTMTGTLKVK